MNVGSVNQVAFSGDTRRTASGNKYEKCDAGKVAGFAYGALTAAVTYSFANASLNIEEVAKTSNVIKPETAKAIRNTTHGAITAGAIMAIAVWTGIGALVDGAINNHRRNNADSQALRDQKLEKHLEKKIRKEVTKEVQQKVSEIKAETVEKA